MLLPFLAGLSLLGLCLRAGKPWRRAVVESMTLWGVYLAVVTELFGAIDGIARGNVVLAWSALLLLGGILVGRRIRRGELTLRLRPSMDLPLMERLILAAVALLVLLTILVALISPPNTWDVVDYHMPRVMQWIQRGNLDYHPTHYCVQLFYPPFAEWVILHFHLLAGTDRFSNLVQCVAFVGCIITSSYVAELLGAGRRGQWIAALLCATLPMAVLAASGSKNDLVSACWLLIAGAFALSLRQSYGRMTMAYLGLASGLAILTKGTAYFFGPSLLLGCLIPWLRNGRRREWATLALVPLLIVSLNLGQYVRNVSFAGSPAGLDSPDGDGKEPLRVRRRPTPPMIAANVVRNLGLHLSPKSPATRQHLTVALRGMISALGEDPDDERASWHKFEVGAYGHNEYFAGSPLHLLLFALAVAWLLVRPRLWRTDLSFVLIGIVGGFLCFSAFYPWTVWSARLHTIPLVFATPVIAALLERARRPLIVAVLVPATALALVDVTLNYARPLVSRGELTSIFTTDRWTQYFIGGPWHKEPFAALVAEIKRDGCREVGIDASLGERFEYPLLWALEAGRGGARVWDVGVSNASARLAGSFEASPPCAVICIGCANHEGKLAEYRASHPCRRTIDRHLLFGERRLSSRAGTVCE